MDLVSALKTFLRVAETGSFSATAGERQVSQPAVSKQISALEAYLNTRLINRATNGVSLTAEGLALLPMARRVVEAAEDLSDAAAPSCAQVTGKVRLSLPAPLGLLLSERMGGLLDRHPRLSVELIFNETPSDLICDGLDLEVRLGSTADNSLVCRRLGWTSAFLVASPDYIGRRGAPETPADLAVHDCIAYSRAGYEQVWWFSTPIDPVSVSITPRLQANNAVAIHGAVRSGAGIAILSHLIAVPDLNAGRLISLMPDYPPLRFPISVVYPSRRNLPLRTRTVLDFLIETVQTDPAMQMSIG